MRFIGFLAGGIDDQPQMVAEIRHHQVVEDAAGGIGEQRVALPALGKPEDVGRNERFQRARRVGEAAGSRPQRDLSHMRDVEQAGGGAGVQVLLDDAGGILHRHLIAGERHHAGPEPDMQVVERRAFERRLRLLAPCRGSLHPPAALARSQSTELARRPDLVQAPHRRVVGRALDQRRIALRLGRDRLHGLHEGVQGRLALGLGRLDHQRLGHDQRKIVGRRMAIRSRAVAC